MKPLLIMFLGFFLIPSILWAKDENVAKAIILRGSVSYHFNGKDSPLAKGQSIPEGSKVKTGDKSFVKLLFLDKSQMNLGPNSQMEINQFPKNKAGIIL